MDEKIIPQSIEAEQSLLGGLMLDTKHEAIGKIGSLLKPDHFYREAHKYIYEAMLEMYMKQEPIDIITVSETLSKKNLLNEAGGRVYLVELTNAVHNAAGVEKYANIVEEKYLLRSLIELGTDISEAAFTGESEPSELLNEAQKKIFELAQAKEHNRYVAFEDLIDHILNNMGQEEDLQLRTHFEDLDNLIGGFSPADLIIIAARPSVGKTSFAMNVALNVAAKGNVPVGIFSIEMPRDQIALRILSSESEIEMNRLKKAKDLQQYEFNKINRTLERIGKAPIFIDDTSFMTTLDLQAKARKMKLEKNIGLFVIDFIQQMYATNSSNRRYENRAQEISEVIRAIKNVARETRVPIIAISQLSRSIEQRANQTPLLSDLRESGEIEQVADMVMFLHREDYQKDGMDTDMASIIIAKNRNGPTGKVPLRFKKNYTRFYNAEEH